MNFNELSFHFLRSSFPSFFSSPHFRFEKRTLKERKKEMNFNELSFHFLRSSFPSFFFFSAFPFRNRWFLLVRSNRTTNAGMNQNLVLKIHSPLYTANLFDTRTNTANQLGTPAVVYILLPTPSHPTHPTPSLTRGPISTIWDQGGPRQTPQTAIHTPAWPIFP